MLTRINTTQDTFFIPFEAPPDAHPLPGKFILSRNEPHPLCLPAVAELQEYLRGQKDWNHNFGLVPGQEGTIIGKMFGVLVVRTREQELGYLAAFSGKLAGGNHHAGFVPPVFDSLADTGFLNAGMEELTRMSQEIRKIEEMQLQACEDQLSLLKIERSRHSATLQQELFYQYHFLNQAGEEKSLNEIFGNASGRKPPSGAGECAGPKLLQYAFKHCMEPLALAEFWWGLSPKSPSWKHGHFYPSCREKCEPILAHMLDGMDCV